MARPARRRWAALGTAAALAAVALAASAARPHPPGLSRLDLEAGGRPRTAWLHAPPASGPAPLVVVLHGYGGDGRSVAEDTRFAEAADDAGFVVAFPDGTAHPDGTARGWNAAACCGPAADEGVDDVAFVGALVDRLVAEGRVDPTRVYATGFSNGGMLAHRLGCELASVAAVASVAGALTVECRPAHPVSVLVVHGTVDPVVPFGGGVRFLAPTERPFPSVESALGAWRRVDACPAGARATRRGTLARRSWGPCAGGTSVSVVALEGAGHGWPGGRSWDNPSGTTDFDATAAAWRFFAAAPRLPTSGRP